MKIKKCELEIVCGLTSKLPTNAKPEFVICGKSNVGKSSFINSFINRKSYARTSQTPGKTRTINYYNINDTFYIVDLPGYGYAKTSLKERENWATFINKYLESSEMIVEIIMLVDIRHAPTDNDKKMFEYILSYTGYEPIIIATKHDKIKRSEVKKNVAIIKKELNASDDVFLIPFSSVTKTGLQDLYTIFDNVLKEE